MKIKLGSIDEETKACRKEFVNFPVGGYTLHCHHEIIGETLSEPAEHRIQYILDAKPEHEQALRLRLFRPISDKKLKMYKKADAGSQKAYADLQKAHADRLKADAGLQKAHADLGNIVHKKFCVKNCPWDGKTIFPKI